jgi:hypothetical protein
MINKSLFSMACTLEARAALMPARRRVSHAAAADRN